MSTTWLWRAPDGLINTGFIAASGSTPAAAACIAWARPISAPPGVTAELSAMFWALNGATRTPRRASQRQMPAVSSDLPASEDVPATSSPPVIGAPPLRRAARPRARRSPAPLRDHGRGQCGERADGQREPRRALDVGGPRRPAVAKRRALLDAPGVDV